MLTAGNDEAPSGNGVTLGFAAASPADVDAFHAAGLEHPSEATGTLMAFSVYVPDHAEGAKLPVLW